ncbi:MAG: PAS domain-containing protein [Phaeospirillum sp.]|nr:PAS domain-containing protein [Phaeospirillum sp.]
MTRPLPFQWNIMEDTDLVAAMMDVVPHPIFFKDALGRYLGGNAQFCAMLGCSLDDLVGKTVFEVAPSYLAQTYHDADLKLMEAGGSQRYVSSVKFGDGVARRGVFYKSVFYDKAGEKAGLVGMFYPMEFLLEVMEL